MCWSPVHGAAEAIALISKPWALVGRDGVAVLPLGSTAVPGGGEPQAAREPAPVGVEGLLAISWRWVLPEFEPTERSGEWQTWYFARSLRYLAYPEAISTFEPGQLLYCMRDVQIPVDSNAIALRTETNALVGHTPAYLIDDLSPVLADPSAAAIRVARVNPEPAPLQNRLQCHLIVRPGVNFHAYRTGRFEAVSEATTPLGPWVRAATAA